MYYHVQMVKCGADSNGQKYPIRGIHGQTKHLVLNADWASDAEKKAMQIMVRYALMFEKTDGCYWMCDGGAKRRGSFSDFAPRGLII